MVPKHNFIGPFKLFLFIGQYLQVRVEKTSLEKTTGFNWKKPDRKTQAF
jgi:hypothetical protein